VELDGGLADRRVKLIESQNGNSILSTIQLSDRRMEINHAYPTNGLVGLARLGFGVDSCPWL
jgi:hypothetical protein